MSALTLSTSQDKNKDKSKDGFTLITNGMFDNVSDGLFFLTKEEESLLYTEGCSPVSGAYPYALCEYVTTAFHNGVKCLSPMIEVWFDNKEQCDRLNASLFSEKLAKGLKQEFGDKFVTEPKENTPFESFYIHFSIPFPELLGEFKMAEEVINHIQERLSRVLESIS